MLNNRKIAVVIPAFNEEKQISMVLETIPDFVDLVVVVDDCSTDKTADIVSKQINSISKNVTKDNVVSERNILSTKYSKAEEILHKMNIEEEKYYPSHKIYSGKSENREIILIINEKNNGVGAAIALGYKFCRDNNIDCTAVMAGDGQMDPMELESICRPVIENGVDYVKGNRLFHRSAWLVVPKIRYFGNSILSILTKVASGYWRVSDTQCGYTAISLKALRAIRIHKIYRGYGMPNDLLVKLNVAYCTIREIEMKPVYDIGETSKMNVLKVAPAITLLLVVNFFKRLWIKYLFRDFHPIFLLYNFSLFLGIIMLPYTVKIIKLIMHGNQVSYETLLVFIFLFTSSFQSLFFAMWMDIQDNERLYK